MWCAAVCPCEGVVWKLRAAQVYIAGPSIEDQREGHRAYTPLPGGAPLVRGRLSKSSVRIGEALFGVLKMFDLLVKLTLQLCGLPC